MATIRKASMPSRSVMTSMSPMAPPPGLFARVADEADAREAGLRRIRNHLRHLAVGDRAIGADVDLGLRFEGRSGVHARTQAGTVHHLAVPVDEAFGVDR